MKRPVFHIVYSYRSGLGVELVRTSALIKRMEATHQICITSFHCFMYDGRFKLNPLSEADTPRWVAAVNEIGVCFDCGLRPNGPFAWRSLVAQAKAQNWLILPEEIDPGEPQLYNAASGLAHKLAPPTCLFTDNSVLSQGTLRSSHIVLNLFGGSSPEKGLAHSNSIRRLTSHLGQLLPEVTWVIPRLPHQFREGERDADFGTRIQLVAFPYESRELTELFHCRGVVTVEGGGFHVALEQGSPTLLVSSQGWLNKVGKLLPPQDRYQTVLTDLGAADQSVAAGRIARWVKSLRGTARSERASRLTANSSVESFRGTPFYP